ncbi:demethylmenaquinone methyltransferase / 2-methoxy-6-polyprenyl-1,4-benzoquinol methylase [Thermoflexales bacterium]|nr:demethylmenaquinone methyltransferase / 2-methoxy-6-polyprenyl-1,4-benzoquinol methylase [Thermoflexales bacterium]
MQQAWNRTHAEQPLVQQPQAEVVHFAEYLCTCLPHGALVLDAGCGRGRNARHLCKLGFAVCACDLSPSAIAIAQQQTASAHFQVADLTHLPYPDNYFAASVCSRVLPYHTKSDLVRSLGELWRVLQPDGKLYLDLLDCTDAEYGKGTEIESHTFLDEGQVPIHFCTRAEIEDMLKGFRIEYEARLVQGSNRVVWEFWLSKGTLP